MTKYVRSGARSIWMPVTVIVAALIFVGCECDNNNNPPNTDPCAGGAGAAPAGSCTNCSTQARCESCCANAVPAQGPGCQQQCDDHFSGNAVMGGRSGLRSMNSLGFSTFGNPSSDDLLAAVPAFVLNMVDQYGYASELLDFADSLSASQRTYAFQLLNGVSASRWNSYRSLIEQSLATAPSALALYGGIMNLDVTDERSRHIIYWTWAQSSNSLLTSPTPQECVPLEAVEAEQAPDQH